MIAAILNQDQQSLIKFRQIVRIKHEAFDTVAADEAIHNFRYVRDGDVPVKEVVGFD